MSKFSLYYPDIFYFKTTFQDKNLNLKVNYNNNNNLNTDNVKGKLLQSILLYDEVYINSWDLPVVIHFFNGKDNAEYIAEKGLVKILNGSDVFLGCRKNGALYTLAGGEFIRGKASNEDEINYMLQSFRGNYNDYANISKSLYNNRLDIEINDFIKKAEKEIRNDISNPEFAKKHNISTRRLHEIYPQDVKVINNQLESYRRLYIAQKSDIKNIFAEDVLVNTIKDKITDSLAKQEVRIDINSEFTNLTRVVRVPDIVEAVNNNILTPKDVLELREDKNCVELRKWIHSNASLELSEKDNLDIIAAYMDTLNKKSKLEKWPMKLLRFVITTGIGFIPGLNQLVGVGASVIDSFLLDRLKSGEWKPNFFIDDYKKLIDKKGKGR